MLVMRNELQATLESLIDQLPVADREILALRHFEQLSPVEAAAILGINDKTGSMRYLRALRRLKDLLQSHFGDASSAFL